MLLLALATPACLPKTPCESSCDPFFDDLQQLDLQDTYRKATLSHTGRLPVDQEQLIIRKNGQAGLELNLDRLMLEEAFYDRVKEIYNDLLLSDQYRSDGSRLLEPTKFPSHEYFDQFGQGTPECPPAVNDGAGEGTARHKRRGCGCRGSRW